MGGSKNFSDKLKKIIRILLLKSLKIRLKTLLFLETTVMTTNDEESTKKDTRSETLVVGEQLNTSETEEEQSKFEIKRKGADVTLDLISHSGDTIEPLTKEGEKKLKWKLWLTVLPLCFMVNATLFIDKDSISYSSLMGLWDDTGMNSADYNNVLTIFYVGYILGQIPSHYLFQRIPMSKFIVLTTALWSVLGYCMLGVKSYKSGITPAVEHTLAMFFPLDEQAIINPIFWISCLGIDVPIGFIAYGLQFVKIWRPWKWFWLLVGIVSNIVCVFSYFYYPDNPATSKIFTVEERIHIIQRVKKSSKSSIEQKTFKKYQLIETLKDPITWLFVLFCFLQMLENSTTYQASIIYTQLGFNHLTTTLLMVVQNGFSTVCAIVGALLMSRFRKQSIYLACGLMSICFIGAILAITIPWDNKPGILAGIFMTRPNGTAYILAFSLAQATAAGYTKRLTRTALFMISYSISNIICPQMWNKRYQPRYVVPWLMQIIFSWFTAPIILLIIRYILNRRNKQRLAAIANGEVPQYGYVDVTEENGTTHKKEVEISMLDLTDLENKNFIYPL
ncbi:hypothetical protein HII13_004522 [Brettanomyces bruxellensis]|nr:hypothetical protein HII13_004522 [Brettanomyces bruxellensis]